MISIPFFFSLIAFVVVMGSIPFIWIFTYDPKRQMEKEMRKEQKRLSINNKNPDVLRQFEFIVEEDNNNFSGSVISKKSGRTISKPVFSKTSPRLLKIFAAAYLCVGVLLYLLLPFFTSG